MSLYTVGALLENARKNKYGVGAFNIGDATMIEPILEAAEAEKAPVILAFYEGHLKSFDISKVIPYSVRCAEQAKVPVAVNLDHFSNIDLILKGLRYGATGAMIDGSRLPYEENIALVKKVVSVCHPMGVTVEAELGIMMGQGGFVSDDPVNTDNYTKPEQAEDFTKKTGIDSLAVAYGSVHGAYKGVPHLDFKRLGEIREKVNTFLVLHGGSGLTDKDFQTSIATGINKINIYTDMSRAAVSTLIQKVQTDSKDINYPDYLEVSRTAIRDTVVRILRVFGSSGKANL